MKKNKKNWGYTCCKGSKAQKKELLVSGIIWIAQSGLMQLGSYNTCNSSTFLAS
jgi:hypothetical protein